MKNSTRVTCIVLALLPFGIYGMYQDNAKNTLRHQAQDFDDHLLRLEEIAPTLEQLHTLSAINEALPNGGKVVAYDAAKEDARRHVAAAVALRRSIVTSPFFADTCHETRSCEAAAVLEHSDLDGGDLRFIEMR